MIGYGNRQCMALFRYVVAAMVLVRLFDFVGNPSFRQAQILKAGFHEALISNNRRWSGLDVKV